MEQKQSLTVYDIAKLAGVSVATVSKVLNHRRGVNSQTAEQVNRVLAETGFKPRWSSLGNRVIGLILPPYKGLMQSAYYASIVANCYDLLIQRGYSIQLICRSLVDTPDSYKKAKLGSLENLCGVIANDARPDYAFLRKLIGNAPAFPCVVIGKPDFGENPPPNASTFNVTVDDFHAGYQMAKMMINYNHRRFLIVTAALDITGHLHRRDGMLAALHDNNIPDSQIRQIEYRREMFKSGSQLAVNIACSSSEYPDAILFSDGQICCGFVMGCRDMRLSIPECFSVAGFEDDKELERLPVRITSMNIPAAQLTEQAVDLLLAQINHEEIPIQEPVQPTLILRDSVRQR